MTHAPIEEGGERYLTLEAVADIYQVRSIVLRKVYDRGLLGTGLTRGATICISTVTLDRVATIVRLHQGWGVDLDALAAWLPER